MTESGKLDKGKNMFARTLPMLGSMVGFAIGGPPGALVGSKLGEVGSNSMQGKKSGEGVWKPKRGQSQFSLWANNAMDIGQAGFGSSGSSGSSGGSLDMGNLFSRTL